jgi:sialic acid synthase SpsE
MNVYKMEMVMISPEHLRIMTEACDGWLSDHRCIMNPDTVKRMATAINAAKQLLKKVESN